MLGQAFDSSLLEVMAVGYSDEVKKEAAKYVGAGKKRLSGGRGKSGRAANVAETMREAGDEEALMELICICLKHPNRVETLVRFAKKDELDKSVKKTKNKDYIHHTLIRFTSVPKKELILSALKRWHPELSSGQWKTIDRVEGNMGQLKLYCMETNIEKYDKIPKFAHYKPVFEKFSDKRRSKFGAKPLVFNSLGGIDYSKCGVFAMGPEDPVTGRIQKILWPGVVGAEAVIPEDFTVTTKWRITGNDSWEMARLVGTSAEPLIYKWFKNDLEAFQKLRQQELDNVVAEVIQEDGVLTQTKILTRDELEAEDKNKGARDAGAEDHDGGNAAAALAAEPKRKRPRATPSTEGQEDDDDEEQP